MSFQPFLAYSASAGSGKTFALSVRYLALLFMGESPRHILAATFTNKAAAEMRQRVLYALRHLGENRPFLHTLIEQTGMSEQTLYAKKEEVLNRFLSESSYIVTLDSFFSSILRSASLEIGLEPDFVTKEQRQEGVEKHFLENLEAEGLLEELVYLALDIEDKRLKKISDMMQGFYQTDPLLPNPPQRRLHQEEVILRIKEAQVSLIERLTQLKAPPRCAKLFEEKDVKKLLNKSVWEWERLVEHSWFKKFDDASLEEAFLALKEALLAWVRQREAMILSRIFHIYDDYRSANITTAKRTGVLSFDDLAYFTYRLLHKSMSREFFYFKIDSQFKHILLDEFQDTSTLQFLLLQPLIDEIFAGDGQSEFKSFFYVGDTKQSLYRFRGGVEALFEKVAEQYGVAIENMNTNYRSAKQIVQQVNTWFSPVMEGYVDQQSPEEMSEGYVEVIQSEALIEDAIKRLKTLQEKGVKLEDIALLVSTNKDGQNLQEACQKAGIPVILKTSSSLKELPKIASLVAMVSYLFYGEVLDAHPLLARVESSLEKESFEWFHPFMTPLALLDRLIREFGYFEEDLNILKLLSFASDFSTIPRFLEEFASSKIPVASDSLHGAYIMTVHGSKGLEFSYVILLDKLTKESHDKAPLLYAYNQQLLISSIFYRMKGRERVDSAYANLLEERKEARKKDRLNLLYVALTRAIDGLFVLKKPKDSLFELLNVEPLSRGVLEVKEPTQEKKGVAMLPTLKLSSYGKQNLSTTQEEEKDYQAMLFGSALHYALEMLPSFELEGLEVAMVALRNRYGTQLLASSFEEIAKRIQRLLECESFLALLEGATLYKEQSLSFEGKLKQVDLLLSYNTHHLVLDYKSSQKYAHKHRKQVAYYAKAIKEITQMPTQAMILYLLEDEIVLEAV